MSVLFGIAAIEGRDGAGQLQTVSVVAQIAAKLSFAVVLPRRKAHRNEAASPSPPSSNSFHQYSDSAYPLHAVQRCLANRARVFAEASCDEAKRQGRTGARITNDRERSLRLNNTSTSTKKSSHHFGATR